MSYILDALKKAERDRHPITAPTLETVHQPAPAGPARPLWPWVAAVVVLVNAGALIWLMRAGPMRSTEIPAGPPVTPAASAPARVIEKAVPARPADPARRVSPPETPASVAAAPPSSSQSSSQSPSQGQTESRPAALKRAEAIRGPAVGPAPKPADARLEPAPKPAPEKPAAPARTPRVPPIASAPSRAPADISTASPEVIQKMKLQVVVYSDVATRRMVYIDNRKYVEGQSIDGKALLESIVPDGVIILHEGKRIKLRASTE